MTARPVIIRDAGPDDWPALYPIFADVVAAGETYAYPEDLSSDEARALWMTPPPDRTSVAVADDGTVLGTAHMGANRPGRGAHVATASFMVDPAAAGRGVGRKLAVDMIDWVRGAGFRAVQFNAVVETNAAAVHLWQSVGFRIIGTVPEAFEHRRHGRVGLHVMHLPL